MTYSLNSLKGCMQGITYETIGLIKGDTRSLDYGSHDLECDKSRRGRFGPDRGANPKAFLMHFGRGVEATLERSQYASIWHARTKP